MPMQTALGAYYMIGEETTWGVPVTPTIGLGLVPGESLKQLPVYARSKGIIAGAGVMRSTQRAIAGYDASGSVPLEMYDRSMSTVLKHMFGNVTGSGPFTYTPVGGSLSGKGLTWQKVLPNSVDGTGAPFTLTGAKIAKWQLKGQAREIATLGLDLVGRHLIDFRSVSDSVTNSTATVTSATAVFSPDDVGKPVSGTNIPANSFVGVVNSATSIGLSSSALTNTPVNASGSGSGGTLNIGVSAAAASYASGFGLGMIMSQSSVTIGGTAYKTNTVTIDGDNKLDQRTFVNNYFIDEPLESGLREYSITIDSEFFSTAAYQKVMNGAEVAVVCNFAVGASTLQITANGFYEADTPTANDTTTVKQQIKLTVDATTTDASALTAVLSTA